MKSKLRKGVTTIFQGIKWFIIIIIIIINIIIIIMVATLIEHG